MHQPTCQLSSTSPNPCLRTRRAALARRVILSLAGLLALQGPAAAQTPASMFCSPVRSLFNTDNLWRARSYALRRILGDISGDGIPDLLSADPLLGSPSGPASTKPTAFVHFATGEGSFSAPVPLQGLPFDGSLLYDGWQVLDVTGDNIAEVVFWDLDEGASSLFLRIFTPQNQTPWILQELPSPSPATLSCSAAAPDGILATGDLDGDGLLDLALASERCGDLYLTTWLKVSGGWSFAADLQTSTGPDYQYPSLPFLTLVDIDGDGLDDAVFAHSDDDVNVGNTLWSAFGDGTGSFFPATLIDQVAYGVAYSQGRISAADLDNDGDQDLALPWLTAVRVYLNDGTGSFSISSDITSATGTDALLTDLDQDGLIDLVAPYAGGGAAWYPGDGAGGFLPVVPLLAAGPITQTVAVADCNGDGWLDILGSYSITGSQPGGSVTTLLATGPGQFDDSTMLAIPSAGADVSDPADMDGDGDLDLIGLADQHSHLVVLYNDGTGRAFTKQEYPSIPSGGAHFLVLTEGDIDGDGDIDIAGVIGGDSATIVENTGPGQFTEVGTYPFVAHLTSWAGIDLADVNGDGLLDLLRKGFGSGGDTLELRLGQPGLSFGPATSWALPWGGYLDVGDADGDGFADVAVTQQPGGGAAQVFHGSSTGLQSPVDITGPAHTPTAIDVWPATGLFADTDQSLGDELIVISDIGSWTSGGSLGPASTGIPIPGLNFTLAGNYTCAQGLGGNYNYLGGNFPGPYLAYGLATVADINVDGIDDLIMGSRNITIALGNGNGGFDVVQDYFPGISFGGFGSNRGFTVADMDGDGLPDIVSSGTQGQGALKKNLAILFQRPPAPSSWSGTGHWNSSANSFLPYTEPVRLAGWGELTAGQVVTVVAIYPGGFLPFLFPDSPNFLIMGTSEINVPFKGGVMVPSPEIIVPQLFTCPSIPLPGGGLQVQDTNWLTVKWPSGIPAGLSMYFQLWYRFSLGGSPPEGWVGSNGLRGITH